MNKAILGTDRVLNWLLRAPNLKIVDLLVWYKENSLGLGSWFRSQAEFAFLIQKHPTNSKLFKNRSFGNVWVENTLPANQRKHPHQKPRELIKAIIEATTQKVDLIVDPCAGSFIVLEVCQEINREFMGVDLNYWAIREYLQPKKTCGKCQQVYQLNKASV